MQILAVISGKGGVGKSTCAVNLAKAFSRFGRKVGILDADIYGPSLREMFPESTPPKRKEDKVIPALFEGIKLMSAAYFNKQEALFVRAPIANQLITQMLLEVEWGELDDLIIDFPPGTGDVQLTLLQNCEVYGAIFITTPHKLSFIDVEKSIFMTRDMGVPLLGIIENMSHFEGNPIFGSGAGQELSKAFYIPLLAEVPISKDLDDIFDHIAQKLLDEKKAILPTFEVKDQGLKVIFPDKMTSEFKAKTLQKFCPCVKCEKQRVEPEDGVKVLQVDHVGRYAVSMKFSSGCSKGIFPFALLRRLMREYV